MRRYNYIARQVSFKNMEPFLNEFAELGYVVVNALPAGFNIQETSETEGSFKTDTYNVIMAQYVGPEAPKPTAM